jgi:hypothetical protein
VTATSADGAHDCNTWPAHIPPLEDCCVTPTAIHPSTVSACKNQCAKNSTNPFCFGLCYAKETGYIVNGKFNKELILSKIESEDIKDRFVEVTKNAIDACAKNAEVQPNVNEQLVTFESCLRTEISKDCLQFEKSAECVKAERFFEDCRRPKANCDVWPKHFKRHEVWRCCKIPEFLSSEMLDQCNKKCLLVPTYDCHAECKQELSPGLGKNNLNLAEVKAGLKARSNPKIDWSNATNMAVFMCDKHRKYRHRYKEPTPFEEEDLTLFRRCVNFFLHRSCLDIGENNCYAMKKFKEQCPEKMPEWYEYHPGFS